MQKGEKMEKKRILLVAVLIVGIVAQGIVSCYCFSVVNPPIGVTIILAILFSMPLSFVVVDSFQKPKDWLLFETTR